MKHVHVPLLEIELIAITRVALGIGLGLMWAGRLTRVQQRAIGWPLLVIGGLTTIPLRWDVLGRRPDSTQHFGQQSLASLGKECAL